jgi:hypothetical protein
MYRRSKIKITSEQALSRAAVRNTTVCIACRLFLSQSIIVPSIMIEWGNALCNLS